MTRRNLLLFALIAAGFLLPQFWARWRVATELLPAAQVAALAADLRLPARGPVDADVTIVFFTDHRCGICRQTERALDTVLAEDPKLRLVYRDWPVLGPDSVAAARIALEANRRGDFLAVHRALMHQPIDQFPPPVALDDADEILMETARAAAALRLPGTPGLVIGPYLVRGGMGAGQIRRLVARARATG